MHNTYWVIIIRGPIDRIIDDFVYFLKCCIPPFKIGRAKRLKTEGIEHCKFWFKDTDMEDEYARLMSQCVLKRKISYSEYVYLRFEYDFGFCEHEKYCIYDKKLNLREGIKKLGESLHSIVHAPLDLVLYRTVGLKLFNDKFNLNSIKELNAPSNFQETKGFLTSEDPITHKFRFILREQQFLLDYFEITTLRDILSNEISKHGETITSLNAWGGLFLSIIITIIASKPNIGKNEFQILLALFVFLFMINIFWHIWVSIKLNEAKDVMYICLGVDIDNPERRATIV